jgi:hypothetical protein
VEWAKENSVMSISRIRKKKRVDLRFPLTCVPERERQVDEQLLSQVLSFVLSLDDVVDLRDGGADEECKNECNDIVCIDQGKV